MNRNQLHLSTLRYLNPDVASVLPVELIAKPQWITWKAGPYKPDGKFDKIPFGKDGTGRGWQQFHQWMTFSEAMSAAKRRGHSGIGFVLPVGYEPTHAFQACDLNHSSISPEFV